MSRTFPRRLFRWFLSRQILIAACALVALDLGILLWLEHRVPYDFEALRVGRETVFVSLVSAAVVLVGVSIFMASQMMGPLGRLIKKTEQIRRFPFLDEEALADDILAYDEPGEWYDLERALNELAVELRKKTIRLSREKTEVRTIMSSINEAVLAVDLERKPLFYNSQFALLFGLNPEVMSEAAVGELIRSPDVLEAFQNSLKSGEITSLEARLETRSESWRHFQLSVAPLRKRHNQEVYGAVAIFHDITDRKRGEQMRVEFVGNVSHELRTPLTSIKGYLQTTTMDIEAGKGKDTLPFLKIMERNVDRLMHLVDELMDLSALQSGVEVRRETVNLETLTKSVLGQVDTRNHKVDLKIDAPTVFAEERRVEQVVRNLLQNAVRYVPAQGEIRIRWQELESGGVRFSVKDNGPGIAKEHIARIFERFYRVDEARTRQVGGSGIGLAIVKHIMLRHGGSVRVVSELGHGAEFICDFP